jgi:L-fuconolactonase
MVRQADGEEMVRIHDIHVHVISPDTQRHRPDPVGGTQSAWSIERPVDAAGLVAAMDEAGVAMAAVVQASTVYGHDNSYVAESVAAVPDRFTGVFSVDPRAPDAVQQVRRWAGMGLTGLRLFTTGSTMPDQADWLDDPVTFPVWRAAADLALPVCLQMRPKGIPQLHTLLREFPDVRVVLDHMARPDLSDGPPFAKADWLWALADKPNVFLKMTSRTVEMATEGASSHADFFPHLAGVFGSGRIAWGSNYPAHAGPLSRLTDEALHALAVLSEADRAMIMGGTAELLYPALKSGD